MRLAEIAGGASGHWRMAYAGEAALARVPINGAGSNENDKAPSRLFEPLSALDA